MIVKYITIFGWNIEVMKKVLNSFYKERYSVLWIKFTIFYHEILNFVITFRWPFTCFPIFDFFVGFFGFNTLKKENMIFIHVDNKLAFQ